MDEKKRLIAIDAESQKPPHRKQQSSIIRFLKSDLFLIVSLVTSILLLCYLLSTSFYKSQRSFHIPTIMANGDNLQSIAVTNENTIDSSQKIDPDKELMKDLLKEKEKEKQLQQAAQDSNDAADADFDVSEEYKTIVALSPVIIISWDDDLVNIPVSTAQQTGQQLQQLQQAQLPPPIGELLESNNQKPESDFEVSKNFKNLLTRNYQILPQPAILSINKHPHRIALINHIMKKVESSGISKKSSFLPGLIINGRPVASAKAIETLHGNGKLLDYLQSWGSGVINVEKV